MKCLCGYEKLGKQWVTVPEKEILYSSGKNKGKVKRVEPAREVFEDVDPEKPEFKKVSIEKDFGFRVENDSGWFGGVISVEIYACPKCGTLKINV